MEPRFTLSVAPKTEATQGAHRAAVGASDIQLRACASEVHVGSPALLIDGSGCVLHVFGEDPTLNVSRAPGAPTALAELWQGQLAAQAEMGLARAVAEQRAVEVWALSHMGQGEVSWIVTLRFVPLPGRGNRFLLTVSKERLEEPKTVLPPCQSLIDALPDPVIVLGGEGQVLAANAALRTWMSDWAADCEAAIRPGADYLALCEQYGGEDLRQAILETLRSGRIHSAQIRWRREAGDLLVAISARPLDLGEVTGVLVSLRDTQLDTVDDERSQLACNVFDNSMDAILTLSPRGHVLLCNPAASRLLGRSAEALRGSSYRRLLAPAFVAARQRRLLRVLASRQVYRGEISVVDDRGKITTLWVAVNAVRDTAGQITQWVVVASDISRLKQTQGKLQQMAFYDSLTGLPNRRLATEHIKAAVRRARRHGTSMSVLFFDLDGFKAINDSLGHDQGDVLLRSVGERLGQQLRSCDLLARLGGDEFVVVVEEAHDERAVHGVAQKLIGALAYPFQLGDHSVRCGTSVGVASFPSCGDDAQTLLRRADLAMYRAKRRGGGSVEYYHPFMEDAVSDRFHSGRALNSALNRGDFRLFFQPIQEVASQRVLGVEALLRMHDGGRWVRPGEFLHFAQAGGLMPLLGEWVLRTACARLGRLSSCGHPDLCMCVNLSHAELAWPALSQVVADALRCERLAAERLVLELPAKMWCEQSSQMATQLALLAETGVRTAADGLSACAELMGQLGPAATVDVLKVEQSLLEHVLGTESALRYTCALTARLHGEQGEPGIVATRRKVRVVARASSIPPIVIWRRALAVMPCKEIFSPSRWTGSNWSAFSVAHRRAPVVELGGAKVLNRRPFGHRAV